MKIKPRFLINNEQYKFLSADTIIMQIFSWVNFKLLNIINVFEDIVQNFIMLNVFIYFVGQIFV